MDKEDKDIYQAAALAALIGILASGRDNWLSAVNSACDIAGLMVRELKERDTNGRDC